MYEWHESFEQLKLCGSIDSFELFKTFELSLIEEKNQFLLKLSKDFSILSNIISLRFNNLAKFKFVFFKEPRLLIFKMIVRRTVLNVIYVQVLGTYPCNKLPEVYRCPERTYVS